MKTYDFFISYRWGRYDDEAVAIAALARSRHYSVWIDGENAPAQEASAHELASHLRTAMRSCRSVIFFETSGRMAAVINGPAVRDISWQERELEFAEAAQLIVLYHSADPSRYGLGINRNLCPYYNLADALDKIEVGMDEPSFFTTQKSPCGSGGARMRAKATAGQTS